MTAYLNGEITDTKISGKDIGVNAQGLPYSICGLTRCLQKAYICLTVKKGSFIYDTDLGIDPVICEQSGIMAAAENALSGTEIVPLKAEKTGNATKITVSTPYGIGIVEPGQ